MVGIESEKWPFPPKNGFMPGTVMDNNLASIKDLAKCASVYKPMYNLIACHVCNRMRFMDGTLNMNIREYLSANTVRVPKPNSIS